MKKKTFFYSTNLQLYFCGKWTSRRRNFRILTKKKKIAKQKTFTAKVFLRACVQLAPYELIYGHVCDFKILFRELKKKKNAFRFWFHSCGGVLKIHIDGYLFFSSTVSVYKSKNNKAFMYLNLPQIVWQGSQMSNRLLKDVFEEKPRFNSVNAFEWLFSLQYKNDNPQPVYQSEHSDISSDLGLS